MQEKKKAELTDEELMSLYQTGDFAAFEVLYGRHSGRIFEYLKKKVSIEVAQDLVQEIFEKLHKSRAKYDVQYPFLPWLFTVSRNTLFDFFKEAETKLSRASNSSPVLLENIAQSALTDHSGHDISIILANLPQNQKRAIELRYLHDWSFEKIADDMKTTEDNTRQVISRGIKKLRLTFNRKGDLK